MPETAKRLAQLEERCAELEAELALFHDAVEHMHQGMCVIDAQGRIVLCNGRYADALELPREAVRPGVTLRELVELGIAAGHHPPGTSAEEFERQLWAGLEGACDSRGTLRRGERTYAVLPRKTAAGRIVGTFEDITAQTTAEQSLRGSEARLNAILDGMPDCVKIFDESGRLIHINPSGLELLQAPNLEAIAQLGHAPVPPEYAGECLDVHRRVMNGETVVWTYEVVGLHGRRRHVEAHAVPFQMPDGSKAHMCISRDVNERQEAHEALRRSEERLRLVQEATGLADFESTPGTIVQLSEAFVEQTGLPPGTRSMTFQDWLDIVHPDDRARFEHDIVASLERDDTAESEFRIIRPDNGDIRWIYSRSTVKRDEHGNPVSSIGAHLDITERKRAEAALRESEERFRLAAEAAGLGIWDYDLEFDRRDWSDRLRQILGVAKDVEPSLKLAESCIHPGDREKFLRTLYEARANDVGRFEASFRIRRLNDNAERWIMMNGWRTHRADNRMRRIIMTVRDITEEKTAEARVRWSASHDALTQLANRSLFHEKLDAAIHKAEQSGKAVGLLLLDMDHFKQINDSLGHDAGDMLLKMFAKRLKGVVRNCDTVARFGGDEFAVVLPELDGEHILLQVSWAIQQRLREPFIHAQRLLDCRVSIGASIFPEHGRVADDLLKNADIALYAAKNAGRGMTMMFEPHMREHVQRRSSMIQLARDAIEEDRVIPYYQPKLNLVDRSLVGFEALLRWRMPNGRIGQPAAVEAAFEDPEVAAKISDRMIERVIADMRYWLSRGVDFGHVAINAAAAEFRRDTFAEHVLEQLARADVPTRCFQLEVTETVFLGRGAEYVHRALALLNMRGVKIALDDFGTGYASLRHLKQFPVDIIKIDQSFVHDMADDPGDEAIIRAVVQLGRSLGIKVVAEGIENEEQARRLVELECDAGQGFLFSRAVPANRVAGLVDRWPVRAAPPLRKVAGDLRLVAMRD